MRLRLTEAHKRILYALACGDSVYITALGQYRLFELNEDISKRDVKALLEAKLITPTRWWLSDKGWDKAPANVAELGTGHPALLHANMKGHFQKIARERGARKKRR